MKAGIRDRLERRRGHWYLVGNAAPLDSRLANAAYAVGSDEGFDRGISEMVAGIWASMNADPCSVIDVTESVGMDVDRVIAAVRKDHPEIADGLEAYFQEDEACGVPNVEGANP